jgi:hypothetical protein
MKTPREILLEHHQAAEPRLDDIRRTVVGELNNNGTKEQSSAAFFVTLLLRCSNKIWLELIQPSRRIWAGIATVWVGIFIVNFSIRDNSSAMAMKSSASPGIMMSVQQQERLLAELTEMGETRAAEPPKKSAPQPRSERRDETAMA